MYCGNCGAEVADDARFCPECGLKLNENKKTENKSNTPVTIGNKSKSKGVLSFLDDWNEWSTGKKIGSLIVACCIGLMVLGLLGSILSPDLNTSTDSSSYSSNNDNDGYVDRYDSYTGGSSSKEVNNVEVDKMELTADQYAFLAYDGTKDYTINGKHGHLYVGPYHDGGSDVDFYYKDGGKYYSLSACDDADKALDKMKQMV